MSESTCAGEGCAVQAGLPLIWGEGTCYDTAFLANRLVGRPDVFPRYLDSPSGWDASAEGSGREFVELLFRTPVYAIGVEIYETFNPSAITRISVAEEYTDDNTKACCGPDFPSPGPCDSYPTCSNTTEWTVLWSGEAGAVYPQEARIFAPSLCPVPHKAQALRVDLDTRATPGWNNIDAVALRGSLDFPSGLVMAGKDGMHRVLYEQLPGVHGRDRFMFQVSDCLAVGGPETVHVELPAPPAAFAAAAYLSSSAASAAGNATTRFFINLNLQAGPGAISAYAHLSSFRSNVTVQLRGISDFARVVLPATHDAAAASLDRNGSNVTLEETFLSNTGGVIAVDLWGSGEGHSELWMCVTQP
jgi:hypothetical protein